MLLEPFGLEYRKDALGAIWLGVSKGCSWSHLAWSIERMLLEPYGLEYGMDNFFWRNIYLSVPLLTQYPPCLPQEERYSIGLLRVRLAPFCRSAWRSAWHPPTQTPLHSPPPQQVGQSPPPAARPRWCPPQGRRTAGEAAGWDDCPASAAGSARATTHPARGPPRPPRWCCPRRPRPNSRRVGVRAPIPCCAPADCAAARRQTAASAAGSSL